MTGRARPIRLISLLTAATFALAACGSGGDDPLSPEAPAGTSAGGDTGEIVIGFVGFAENEILANIYYGALKAKGVNVSVKDTAITSRETYIPALQDGSIHLVPEYTGVLTQFFNKEAKATDPDGVFAELKAALPESLTVLDKAEAQDKDSVVVRKETAQEFSLVTIADLAPVAKDLVIGGPPEWKTRQTGIPGLKAVYGLEFKEFKPLDVAGPLSVNALKNGQVDVVNLFTTQSAVAVNGFVTLEDPKSFFAAQNIVPLIATAKVNDTVSGALNAVSAKLDTPTVLGLVAEVEVDKKDPSDVAAAWLTANSLG